MLCSGGKDGTLKIWKVVGGIPDRKRKRSDEEDAADGSNTGSDTDSDASSDEEAAEARRRQRQVAAGKPTLELFRSVPVDGYINGLRFSADGRSIIVATAKEHKLGRWSPMNGKARNRIVMVAIEEL